MANYLYILTITSGLPSMGRGKSVAHGAHAANMFTSSHLAAPLRVGVLPDRDVSDWHCEGDGFGTTIALDVGSKDNMLKTIEAIKEAGFRTGVVTDPTYPYEVNAELFQLIDPNHHTQAPIPCGDKYICFRKEQTAAYVFGDKEALEPILGKFNLLSNDTLPLSR